MVLDDVMSKQICCFRKNIRRKKCKLIRICQQFFCKDTGLIICDFLFWNTKMLDALQYDCRTHTTHRGLICFYETRSYQHACLQFHIGPTKHFQFPCISITPILMDRENSLLPNEDYDFIVSFFNTR